MKTQPPSPRIGITFGEYKDKGLILQSYNKLPKYHGRETEVGPFYGVTYESGKYVWYSKKEIIELLKSEL